jgi:hypothetical protein
LTVDEGSVDLFLTDDLPERGEAICLRSEETDEAETVYGVAGEHLGGHKVRALVGPLPDWVAEGVPAEPTGRRAGFDAPPLHAVDLTTETIQPEGATDDWIPLTWQAPDFADLDGERPAVTTGWDHLDAAAPLADGGVNLLIDLSADTTVLESMADRLLMGTEPGSTVWAPSPEERRGDGRIDYPVGRTGLTGHLEVLALRLACALSVHRRDAGDETLTLLSLPPVAPTPSPDARPGGTAGYADLIDRIGSALASTRTARVTSLLYLPVPASVDGIDAIVETLGLGDVDVQIVVDRDGRFAPRRSTSDAERSPEVADRRDKILQTLHRAEQARDKARLLGEVELTDAERDALEQIDEYREEIIA